MLLKIITKKISYLPLFLITLLGLFIIYIFSKSSSPKIVVVSLVYWSCFGFWLLYVFLLRIDSKISFITALLYYLIGSFSYVAGSLYIAEYLFKTSYMGLIIGVIQEIFTKLGNPKLIKRS